MKSTALLLTLALGCNTIRAQQKQFTIDEATGYVDKLGNRKHQATGNC